MPLTSTNNKYNEKVEVYNEEIAKKSSIFGMWWHWDVLVEAGLHGVFHTTDDVHLGTRGDELFYR